MNSSETTDNQKCFYNFLENNNLYFTQETIENYLLSLKTKPFVILTGNSGTGKTKLSQYFSKYLGEKIGDENLLYELVPVGANWTENRNILGYENIITNSYHSTPALDLILKAQNDMENPYFLILDEMNLSHVERYFSDFLSAMESRESVPLYTERKIKVKDSEGNTIEKYNYEVFSSNGVLIPSKLEIPPNLFIIGTVNVDETTYMFSPKVLDRANVLEFETIKPVDYKDFEENEDKKPNFADISFLEEVLYNNKYFNPIEEFRTQSNNIKEMSITDLKIILDAVELLDDLKDELLKFQIVLKDSRFDFGFRVVNEILRFIVFSWVYEEDYNDEKFDRYFDTQVKQKILPKLHGSERELKETLENLRTLCAYGRDIEYDEESEDDFLKSLREKQEISIEKSKYNESAKKLDKMLKVLEQQKYVSFIN